MLSSKLRIERSGGRKARKSVKIALVFSHIRTKQLERRRMDSWDSEKIGTTADNTPGPILPTSPLIPPNDSIPLPRSLSRPPVPPSPLELLPTEIHTEIVEIIAGTQRELLAGYNGLSKLARTSPVFTQLAQNQLYRRVLISSEGEAEDWLESPATIRGEHSTKVLWLMRDAKSEDDEMSEVVERVLAVQTSALEVLHLQDLEIDLVSTCFDALSGEFSFSV